MKILVAPDKFKDALDAKQVCKAIAEGIHSFDESIEIVQFPMADGGNGTAALLTWHNKGKKINVQVNDPLGRPVQASYGLSGDKKTAYIEMAAANGIELLKYNERNPLKTTTTGTGQLIKDAMHKGAENIILGIGGSATNDAGIGMAQALGFTFLDKEKNEVSPTGENLQRVAHIIKTKDKNLQHLNVVVACDVNNPLYGENGAASIYGPQKGARAEDVKLLDAGLRNIARIFHNFSGKDVGHEPGAGAAGGLGAGCMVFLDAALKQGIQLYMEATRFEEYLGKVDLIITGEGKLDSQSLQGKVVSGICLKAQEMNIPVAALCGTLALNADEIKKSRLVYASSILNRPLSIEEAIEQTPVLLKISSFQLTSLFMAGKTSF